MSIYIACRQAATEILENPEVVGPDVYGVEGIFTELDVILRAAKELNGASGEQRQAWMQLAQREASQVMGGLFRSREVARFGPVRPPGKPGLDYVRASSKIVYSSLDGPQFVETPNGIFIRLFHEADPIAKRRGRKLGKSRNDFELWEKQETISKDQTAEQREILRLQTELSASYRHLNKTHAELDRLREHVTGLLTREEAQQMISSATQSLESKIRRLENQVV